MKMEREMKRSLFQGMLLPIIVCTALGSLEAMEQPAIDRAGNSLKIIINNADYDAFKESFTIFIKAYERDSQFTSWLQQLVKYADDTQQKFAAESMKFAASYGAFSNLMFASLSTLAGSVVTGLRGIYELGTYFPDYWAANTLLATSCVTFAIATICGWRAGKIGQARGNMDNVRKMKELIEDTLQPSKDI